MDPSRISVVSHSGAGSTGGVYAADPLLARLGDVAGAHAVVIGSGAIDTMCALFRLGCAAVTEMTVTERAHAEPAEIAIVPRAGSPDMAVRSIELAFRALLPGGRIVLRDPTGAASGAISVALRRRGFSAVRIHVSGAEHVVTAERPIFGRMALGA